MKIRDPGCRRCGRTTAPPPTRSGAASTPPSGSGWRRCSSPPRPRWCAEHGIALTGHPAESEELSPLRWFQLPGQDMVWRYVEPDQPTAIEGRHSVAAKVATSGARIQGARRILTEVCGAYGWRMTLEEMKWLFDWHLVRGNNLIDPHAVFYSIRGRRAWESEPDLCLHNTWRPYVGPGQPLRPAPELAAVRRRAGVRRGHPGRWQRHRLAGGEAALPAADRLPVPGRARGGGGIGGGRHAGGRHAGRTAPWWWRGARCSASRRSVCSMRSPPPAAT